MTKSFSNTMIGISIVYIILGIVLVGWPEASQLAICYVLGAGVALYGAYRIIAYFAGGEADAMQFGVAVGIGCVLAGLLVVLRAGQVVALLGVLIGIAVIIDSVLRVQIALNIRRAGGGQWKILLICALCILVFGFVLAVNPFKVVRTATIIAGVALLIDGLLTLWSVLQSNSTFRAVKQRIVK